MILLASLSRVVILIFIPFFAMKISIFGIGSSSKMDCRRAFIICSLTVLCFENVEAEINIYYNVPPCFVCVCVCMLNEIKEI